MTEQKTNREQEKEMRYAFLAQAHEILSSPDRFLKSGDELRIGFESEIAIYRDGLLPKEMEYMRNAIIEHIPDIADVELGAAQIEFRTPPVNILSSTGILDIAAIYESNFARILYEASRVGCNILRIGANPFLPIKDTPRTNTLKYQLVPDYYNQRRPKETDTIICFGNGKIDIGDAAIVSLLQSFQVNIEANSFQDACDKMNRSFMISPYFLAIGANARYLECIDTELQDMRMRAWEITHDTGMQDIRSVSWEKAFDIRTQEEIATGHMLRVGLPERYFKNIKDYFMRAGRFPFILYNPDAAFAIAIGMTWLDTRVKCIGDSLVVELRSLPTQPTQEEELFLTLAYVGRLTDSQVRHEPLMPIEYVRENRLSAMLYGTHRDMWFVSNDGTPERLPFRDGMRREAQRIAAGLRMLGLPMLDEKRFCNAISPSDRLAGTIQDDQEPISSSSIARAMMETGMLL